MPLAWEKRAARVPPSPPERMTRCAAACIPACQFGVTRPLATCSFASIPNNGPQRLTAHHRSGFAAAATTFTWACESRNPRAVTAGLGRVCPRASPSRSGHRSRRIRRFWCGACRLGGMFGTRVRGTLFGAAAVGWREFGVLTDGEPRVLEFNPRGLIPTVATIELAKVGIS